MKKNGGGGVRVRARARVCKTRVGSDLGLVGVGVTDSERGM